MQINISIIDIKFLSRLFNYILDLVYTKYILILKKYKETKNFVIIIYLRFRKSLKIYILFIFSIYVANKKKLFVIVKNQI